MKIDVLVLPPLENNCYILSCDNKAIIIDPSSEKDKLIKACEGYDVIEILVSLAILSLKMALAEPIFQSLVL